MSGRAAIGVVARAPIAGGCKRRLLAAHSPEWAAGLHAAMLRDTLDGLLSVAADDYVVFLALGPDEASEEARGALGRHVPPPWRIEVARGAAQPERLLAAYEALAEGDGAWRLIVAADAPAAPTAPIADLLDASRTGVVLGPSEADAWVFGATTFEPRLVRDLPWQTPALAEAMRVRCHDLALELHELPRAYAVREPSDVLRLVDDLRRDPNLAPRTAQYLVTSR